MFVYIYISFSFKTIINVKIGKSFCAGRYEASRFQKTNSLDGIINLPAKPKNEKQGAWQNIIATTTQSTNGLWAY
jgi:hypothetical protein